MSFPSVQYRDQDGLSEAAQDFINYIMSDEGQKIIEDAGYVSVGSKGAFTSNGASGKVVVAGSSSVSPCMEKPIEAYEKVNSNVTVELQTSDSTTGVNMATEGTCDIGMASRELKDSEKSNVTATVIAKDGIAIVVNKDNSVSNLTKDRSIASTPARSPLVGGQVGTVRSYGAHYEGTYPSFRPSEQVARILFIAAAGFPSSRWR